MFPYSIDRMSQRIMRKRMYGGYRKKMSYAKKALNMAKANKKMLSVGAEVTSNGSVHSTTAFNATPIVTLIQGEGNGTRTKLTSVQLKGTVKQDVSTTGDIQDYRVDLVLDRMPISGENATPAMIYGSATPQIGELKNLLYKKRFKLLRTHIGVFPEGTAGNATGHVLDWYVKLNLVQNTSAVGNWTNSDIQNNAILLVYWTTSTSNQPIPSLKTRLNCRDV